MQIWSDCEARVIAVLIARDFEESGTDSRFFEDERFLTWSTLIVIKNNAVT